MFLLSHHCQLNNILFCGLWSKLWYDYASLHNNIDNIVSLLLKTGVFTFSAYTAHIFQGGNGLYVLPLFIMSHILNGKDLKSFSWFHLLRISKSNNSYWFNVSRQFEDFCHFLVFKRTNESPPPILSLTAVTRINIDAKAPSIIL